MSQPSAVQMKRCARDDVRLEEECPFNEECPLIVEQMVPPPCGHEFRQDDSEKIVLTLSIDTLDVLEQRLQQRAVGRLKHDQRNIVFPPLSILP